jgi:hypothetical protein
MARELPEAYDHWGEFHVKAKRLVGLVVCAILTLSGCELSNTQIGGGSTPVPGTSNLYGGVGYAQQLIQCHQPLGTADLTESQYMYGSSTLPNDPGQLVKLMMQQSNCFLVVERGRAMEGIMGERQFRDTGELRQNSNFGKHQIVASDFSITPTVVLNEPNARGSAAGLGLMSGLAGSAVPFGGALVGALGAAASSQTSEVHSTISIVDNRSTVQVAMAEGSATQTDNAYISGLFGQYARTDIERVEAASLLDAYNKVVSSLQASGYKYQQQPHNVYQPQETNRQ